MNFLQKADVEYSKNNMHQVASYLKLHLEKFSGDVRIWHRLALIEESLGNWKSAGIAHKRCITLMPNAALAYCHAGAWLADTHAEAAAASFSLAYDIEPKKVLQLINSNKDAIYQKTISDGIKLMCEVLEHHHHSATHMSTNVSNAKWVRYEVAKFASSVMTKEPDQPSQFKPELFRIDNIRKQTYYSANEFVWADDLINATSDVKKELEAFLDNDTNTSLRPYLDKGSISDGSLSELAGSSNWSALDLYKNGQLNEKIAKHFPATLNALHHVPCYGLDERPFEVFFSVLTAGQKIAPHYGQSNHSLTVHLPVDAPNDGYLEVNQDRACWADNELIIFDDSFLHSANNASDQKRIILLFSIWHPDLNEDDRIAVKKTFRMRGEWLKNRYRNVMAALPS